MGPGKEAPPVGGVAVHDSEGCPKRYRTEWIIYRVADARSANGKLLSLGRKSGKEAPQWLRGGAHGHLPSFSSEDALMMHCPGSVKPVFDLGRKAYT